MYTFENSPFYRMGLRDHKAHRDQLFTLVMFYGMSRFPVTPQFTDAYMAGWDSIV